MYLKSTPLQKCLAILSWLLFIGGIGYLICFWEDIPNEVPIHSTGVMLEDIDRYGNKTELIGVLLIFILLYFILCIISYFPADFNMPSNIKDEHRDIINNYTKTKWLFIRVEYLLFIIYFVWRIISLKWIDNGIFIFICVCTCTIMFFNFRLEKYK